ncbi:tripartite tricarboxylate transporter substrate binding protein [Ramlibacter sp. WS9]|uniref:Bug family tripartite tricarboxylate transporter substrate binding protein n=1 Tax=Ramlibacter sp. WS9 TaxID=1882741 RepID=UPI001143A2DA|nr:tripartite tricarboxylate transporter substrate binding protein [Ramlibacter sp. WS9]ROZ69217.1 tripartite tricarboxylate transporter substrate binding protein [Ramlibacter sp. WS9]
MKPNHLNARRRSLLLASAGLVAASVARAQADFPTRPLRLVVPFPAGGPTDSVARLVGAEMAVQLKQTVVIDNKSGGVGQIGHEDVRRSPADGYTLVSLVIPAVLNYHFLGKQFSAARDFTPIGLIATQFNVLVINPALPDMAGVTTVAQLMAAAKKRPGGLAYTSAGQGSLGHLTGARLAQMAGAPMTHIPYRGAQPAMLDVLGGQVPMMLADSATALPQLRSGKLRALAVTSSQRVKDLPEVPTLVEQGFPDLVVTPWSGLAASPGLSATVQARLAAALKAAMDSPAVQDKLQGMGMTPHYLNPSDFAALADADFATYGRVIRENGIAAQ